jgi:hypothetical protein
MCPTLRRRADRTGDSAVPVYYSDWLDVFGTWRPDGLNRRLYCFEALESLINTVPFKFKEVCSAGDELDVPPQIGLRIARPPPP